MIAPNFDSLCAQAELHYYEFVSGKGHQLIPESITNHIEQCSDCLARVGRLETALSETPGNFDSEQSQIDSAVIGMLKIHFAYVGRRVTCNTVKPFLCALLDPALQIRIPTPITAHLDNCERCSEDLETIERLNLDRKQLYRLSQLFAEEPPQDYTQCSRMRETAKSVAAMNFAGISAKALKHMCKCPVCRGAFYEERQDLCNSLTEYDQSGEFMCESVAVTDIFDYVVPYGLDPASDQYARFRESLISHLRCCPTCLAKMQQLHKTVYGISERAESDVVTVFRIDEPAKAQKPSQSDDLYAGFPIRVELRGRRDDPEQSVSTIDSSAALKQKTSAINLKLLVRAAAVAAVILLAFALLLNTPTAKAITIGQIYDALEKAKNVHISSFVPDRADPVQEKWVSKTLNIYMTKTGNELVFWDIANDVRKTKQLDTGLTETITLTSDLRASAERRTSGSLGLTPFYDLSRIPKDAEWAHVADAALGASAKETEVYDLAWAKATPNSLVGMRKCRLFVDAKTNLPRKTELYEKLSDDSEYILTSVIVVEYVSDSEIQTLIRKEACF